MILEDVVSLTQNAVSQVLGEKYKIVTGTEINEDGVEVPTYVEVGNGKLAELPENRLIDVGKDIQDYENGVERYTKSQITLLSRTENIIDEYEPEIPSIMVKPSEWGGFIQRNYYEPAELIEDPMYNLIDGKVYEDHKFYQPKVTGKIFAEGKGIMCPISIVRDQLFESFRSWDSMNGYLDTIKQNVQNTISLGINLYQHMLISVAYAIAHTATENVLHALTEYQAFKGDDTITKAQALADKDFYSFLAMRIAEIKDNMRIWSTAYNNGSIPTFTKPSRCKVILHSKIARGFKFLTKANTFNKDEVGFGEFDTIATWQATIKQGELIPPDEESEEEDPEPIYEPDEKFTWNATTTIMLSADSDNKLGLGTSAVTLTDCIGLIYDNRAIGMTLNKEKITNNYTATADFWNEYVHKLVNYIVDANCNMVAITMD